MSNCIFCKIVNGELPSTKVYENDDVLAFLDLSQITKGHTLVIPKIHNENIYDLSPAIAAKLFEAVPAISRAINKEFEPQGLNLLNNNGTFAGQAVFHFHLHLIPRYDENDGFDTKYISHQEDYTREDLENIAHGISKNIQ
ncbi:HIT family protein [Lederbergia lenta]|uniref:Histidine triad (HIT) protein n=1 Tax=Lederbergia lenta TaxID=1467 RepID=A0A2X4WCV7_LEDLE|nr:HIT family protein [Lederbergia lenta]MCM3110511.1 HIT family protein [Lederbergia lenta]MEC2323923.1 HIT family protein [Lederbergia lenta]SQI61011.1 histidine triad (HIT) protein [Lederbergia lenta]